MFWENVGGSLSLPLLPLQTFDIDIGDAARIESIRIVNGQVRCELANLPWRVQDGEGEGGGGGA